MTKLAAFIAKMKADVAATRKSLVGPVGVIAAGLSFGIFHGDALIAATAVIAVATRLGIWVVPNTPTPAPPAPPA